MIRTLLPILFVGVAFARQPDFVIRRSAREVLLDVVVRDAHGKLATNLKPEEVTVYEDGARRDIRSFRLVAGSEVRADDERQAAEARAGSDSAAQQISARRPVNPCARST